MLAWRGEARERGTRDCRAGAADARVVPTRGCALCGCVAVGWVPVATMAGRTHAVRRLPRSPSARAHPMERVEGACWESLDVRVVWARGRTHALRVRCGRIAMRGGSARVRCQGLFDRTLCDAERAMLVLAGDHVLFADWFDEVKRGRCVLVLRPTRAALAHVRRHAPVPAAGALRGCRERDTSWGHGGNPVTLPALREVAESGMQPG